MKNTVINFLERVKQSRGRRRRAAAILVCLSLIVGGGTAWALHMKGESQTGKTYCGYEEHQHDDSCVEKTLICGYDAEETAEPEPEQETAHTHTDECYETQTVLTCTMDVHQHSEDGGCYDEDGNLICEIPEHTHSEEAGCYTEESVLVCGKEEGGTEASAGDAAEETETASDTDHVHTDECYEITYTCGYDYEHTHTLSCFSNPEADVETADVWEKTVSDVELTGDFATDLVAVAKTQLGYEESADNYQVALDDEGNETTETMGYTRYGAWYGDAYGDWDAMFASFCLNYAGITSEMAPYEASCPDWAEDLSRLGFYEPALAETPDGDGGAAAVRNDYTPETGDLVFFDWDGDGSANHVGIVEELETKETTEDDGAASYEYVVHTIEGDDSGKVTRQKYDLEDEEILSYGSIYSVYLAAVDDGLIENVRRLTAETEDGMTFSAIGEIPDGAALEVSPLTGEQNTYLKKNFGLTGSFYDIKIIQEDGKEYQPEKTVQISVSGLGYDARYALTGYHLTDVSDENLMDVDANDVTVEEVDVNNTGNRIGFGADGFSIYGVGTYSETAATYAEGDSVLSWVTNVDTKNLGGQTFAITGYSGYSALTSTAHTSGGLVGETPTTDSVIWTFEAVNASQSTYRIRAGTNTYLWLYRQNNNNTITLATTTSETNATTFTVSNPSGDTSHILISVSIQNTTYYVNAYQGDGSGRFYYWTDADTGSQLRLYELKEPGAYDLDSMTLWLHTAKYNENTSGNGTIHYSTTTVAYYDGGTETNHYDTLKDAKQVVDNEGNITYLIPVTYLESAFGFDFNSAEADTYPIVYVPSATAADSDTSKGAITPTYMELDGTWYIQVTDTTGAATPRSNIYWINATEATDTVTPASTVINVFDYWVYENVVNDHDSGNQSLTAGINSQGGLNFVAGNAEVTADGYTGSPNPRTGIVQNKLVDGYPQLTTSSDLGTDGSSLNYLFNPDVTATGKTSYANVGNLLTVNSDGYYYYNSQERFATLNTETGDFIEYTTPAVSAGGSSPYGQFFPFNTIAEGALNNSLADYMNHYFGVSLTTRFLQQFEGYTTSSKNYPTTFEFTGDDDVWIFIDDVLVADLGGIHDAASVVINFVTGAVTINSGTNYATSTNLKALFTAAGAADSVDWSSTQPNTFADSSSEAHTLKFYYLERGNTDSNMLLKYNLNDIPATGLFKVDQYGEALSGATFAVYASDADGNYLSNLNGNVVTLTGDVKYDETTWDILGSDGSILAKALYYGTTDAAGEMYFTDKDGMPLPISDLQSMFGTYFLLREVDVPDGYRTVSDDVLLKIENGLLQTAESSYLSGVWSSPNALVTATNTLYVANENDYSKVGAKTDGSVTYYTPASGNEEGEANGSLFAVVLYKGTQTGGFDTWTPVSGNDVEGYDYHRTDDERGSYSNVTDAITAAKSYGTSHVFSYSASGMQALIEELPGEITDYYTVLEYEDTDGTTADAKYLVAYYYTTVDIATNGWGGVNSTNTARVASHASTTVEGDDGFTVQWGATIEVPNTVNALYFQKADSDGDLLDNAVFALYEAETNENIGYYKGTDNDDNTVYIRLDEDTSGNTAYGSAAVYDTSFENAVTGTYTIQSGSTQSGGYITDFGAGTITVTVTTTGEGTDATTSTANYTITPATNASTGGSQSLVGYTHDTCATSSEDGTGHFQYLDVGKYFLKEVQAPNGYSMAYQNTPVEVTNETVYANAGDRDNGVRVGNGVGYLVKTMDVFASLESINETLSWVYTHLKVVTQDTSEFHEDLDNAFYTYGDYSNESEFKVGKSNGNETTYISKGALTDDQNLISGPYTPPVDGAMTQYLRYEGDLTETTDQGSVFDYALYGRTDSEGNALGAHSYRLWTESGWSDLAIFQDYAYGSKATKDYTQYTKLSDLNIGEISYLFSSSTFVQVTDAVDVDLTVTKVTTGFETATTDNDDNPTTTTATTYLDGAEFYLTNSQGKYYKYTPATATAEDKTEWVDTKDEATKLTTETYFTYEKGGVTTTEKITTSVSVNESNIVTKTYKINGTDYTLTSYENTGEATFTEVNGTGTLTGTLQRSFFKIYNLTEGTYTLTEVKAPAYSYTVGGATTDEKFILDDTNSTTKITLASGSYWYYITTGTGNTIIVPQDDIKTTETVNEQIIPKTFLYRTENGDMVEATVTNTNTKTEDGGYSFTFTYDGKETTNTLYLNATSGFTLEVSGEAATRVFKVDSTGTTAAYYDSHTTAYQGGFRVMNTSEVSEESLTLVKVDKNADESVERTTAGYNEDETQFTVTATNGDTTTYSAHNVLTGAKFYLYYKSTDENAQEKYYYSVDDNGVVQWSTSLENAEKVAVNEHGALTFSSLNATNTYYLVECQAPDGYNLLTEELEVSWDDSTGALTVVGATPDETYHLETVTNTDGTEITYLVVYNESGYSLPKTGGTGTIMFTVGGLLLITVTLVYGCGLRRKRERRTE